MITISKIKTFSTYFYKLSTWQLKNAWEIKSMERDVTKVIRSRNKDNSFASLIAFHRFFSHVCEMF